MGSRSLIILDTHVLIWLDEGNNRLGKITKNEIDAALAKNELAVSAISFREVAMLVQKRRIELSADIDVWRKELLGFGLKEIPVSGSIGIMASQLTNFHGDPADRIIMATALKTSGLLLTADKKIIGWGPGLHCKDASM